MCVLILHIVCLYTWIIVRKNRDDTMPRSSVIVGSLQISENSMRDEAGNIVSCDFCSKYYAEFLCHVPIATKDCGNQAMKKRKRIDRKYLVRGSIVGCPMCCACENCRARVTHSDNLKDSEINFVILQDNTAGQGQLICGVCQDPPVDGGDDIFEQYVTANDMEDSNSINNNDSYCMKLKSGGYSSADRALAGCELSTDRVFKYFVSGVGVEGKGQELVEDWPTVKGIKYETSEEVYSIIRIDVETLDCGRVSVFACNCFQDSRQAYYIDSVELMCEKVMEQGNATLQSVQEEVASVLFYRCDLHFYLLPGSYMASLMKSAADDNFFSCDRPVNGTIQPTGTESQDTSQLR